LFIALLLATADRLGLILIETEQGRKLDIHLYNNSNFKKYSFRFQKQQPPSLKNPPVKPSMTCKFIRNVEQTAATTTTASTTTSQEYWQQHNNNSYLITTTSTSSNSITTATATTSKTH